MRAVQPWLEWLMAGTVGGCRSAVMTVEHLERAFTVIARYCTYLCPFRFQRTAFLASPEESARIPCLACLGAAPAPQMPCPR
eukprot:COSAG01_NODE_7342_length_3242_cov_21.565383_2_plen_82_part_00